MFIWMFHDTVPPPHAPFQETGSERGQCWYVFTYNETSYNDTTLM